MSFRGMLRHTVAIVTPSTPDLDDLDEAGFPITGAPTIRVVPAMVQPRDAHEVRSPIESGAEISDFIIFLEMMPLSAAAYIVDADDDGPIAGGRRFQINGIMPFDYGTRDDHLEVLATLIGSTDPDSIIPGS